MANVIVADSKIHGLGVFATRDFTEGEIILAIDDTRVDDDEHPLHGGDVWQCNCGSTRCRGMIVSSFFELPVELQLENLPLLNEWFIDEHREKVDALRKLLES